MSNWYVTPNNEDLMHFGIKGMKWRFKRGRKDMSSFGKVGSSGAERASTTSTRNNNKASLTNDAASFTGKLAGTHGAGIAPNRTQTQVLLNSLYKNNNSKYRVVSVKYSAPVSAERREFLTSYYIKAPGEAPKKVQARFRWGSNGKLKILRQYGLPH